MTGTTTPTTDAKTLTVIGSTGLVGTQLVGALTDAGHSVIEVSQSTRADVFTGEGLEEALTGSDAVIDVVNSPTPEDPSEAFFKQASANLAAAAVGAGVGHYVVLSIVGADELAPQAGYMRGKLAQEAAAQTSGLPWTVVRSTQFHELTAGITESLVVGDQARVPDASIQTIASSETVEILARIATGAPHNAIVEVGGPERTTFADMARTVLDHQGRDLTVVTDPTATYFGHTIDGNTLVPDNATEHGTTTLSTWLART